MGKISCEDKRRVPAAYNGVQVNYCKNPLCPNYGVPVSNDKQPRGRYGNPLKRDGYTAGIRYEKDQKTRNPIVRYICKYCGANFPGKSNLGISEETSRYSSYLEPVPDPACPNEQCPNFGKSILENTTLYRNKGFATKARSTKKYLCKSCGSHISIQVKSSKRQRIPYRNKYILRALCNKVPIRCIADIFDLKGKTIYDRIDFLYEQCKNFVAARERRFKNTKNLRRLYLSVDRQIYLVNWWQRKKKRNIPIYATCCADNESKYVFAIESNYDPDLEWAEIEKEAESIGDYSKPIVFRKFARLWLHKDFDAESAKIIFPDGEDFESIGTGGKGDVEKEIRKRYRQVAKRKDVESADNPNLFLQLPKKGMIVRLEYCLYAFFIHLKKLLPNVEKIRFFLDQESGIRSACLSAFRDEILNRTCDAFYVSINRNMTIDERRKAKREGEQNLKLFMKMQPDLTIQQARLQILIQQLRKMDEIGQYKDKWFTQPFPTIMEPEKKIAHLTDFGDYETDHRAWLYNKASLFSVNHFFNHLRRKQSLLERPIATPSGLNRKWYGYAPYQPGIINKILLIHRVWYNYLKKNRRTKITPAMRLGLAKAPIDPEVIIYGRTVSESKVKPHVSTAKKKKAHSDFLNGPEPIGNAKAPLSFSGIDDPERTAGKNINTGNRLQTVFLDLETTGVGTADEIVEIALVDGNGETILNSLVKASADIHPAAGKMHGITKDMLSDAPTINELEEEIIGLISGKRVVSYNISFDMRFLTGKMRSVTGAESCCMLRFADYFGRLSKEMWPYQWQTLQFAVRFVKYEWSGPHHRALSDALACRAVWRHMNKNPIK